MDAKPFQPAYGTGIALTANAVSQTAALPLGSTTVCISNTGSGWAAIRIGATAVAASETVDYLIPPGMQLPISKDPSHTALTYISATGTTLQVIAGVGL